MGSYVIKNAISTFPYNGKNKNNIVVVMNIHDVIRMSLNCLLSCMGIYIFSK